MAVTEHLGATGNYQVYYGDVPLGWTDSGWTVEIQHQGSVVTFEEFGDSAIDVISRGATVTVEATLKEFYRPALQSAVWPWATPDTPATMAQDWGLYACAAGAMANNIEDTFSKKLEMIPTGCVTPTRQPGVGGVNPQTYGMRFFKTIFDPGFSSSINFNNELRQVPIRFMVFLVDISAETDLGQAGSATFPTYRWFEWLEASVLIGS